MIAHVIVTLTQLDTHEVKTPTLCYSACQSPKMPLQLICVH